MNNPVSAISTDTWAMLERPASVSKIAPVSLHTVVQHLREVGSIKVDCGNDSFREFELALYKNATEAALEAVECAKRSPYSHRDSADSETPAPFWEDRMVF